MIKVKIRLPSNCVFSYEGVWAKELSENTGEINNIPIFSKEYRFGDIVEYDPESKEVTKLIRDGGYLPAEIIRYERDFMSAKCEWEAKGYDVEGWAPGIMGVTRKQTEPKA